MLSSHFNTDIGCKGSQISSLLSANCSKKANSDQTECNNSQRLSTTVASAVSERYSSEPRKEIDIKNVSGKRSALKLNIVKAVLPKRKSSNSKNSKPSCSGSNRRMISNKNSRVQKVKWEQQLSRRSSDNFDGHQLFAFNDDASASGTSSSNGNANNSNNNKSDDFPGDCKWFKMSQLFRSCDPSYMYYCIVLSSY